MVREKIDMVQRNENKKKKNIKKEDHHGFKYSDVSTR
jgi:hypothetical protein